MTWANSYKNLILIWIIINFNEFVLRYWFLFVGIWLIVIDPNKLIRFFFGFRLNLKTFNKFTSFYVEPNWGWTPQFKMLVWINELSFFSRMLTQVRNHITILWAHANMEMGFRHLFGIFLLSISCMEFG